MQDKYTIFSHKAGHISLEAIEDVTNDGYSATERQWVICVRI